MEYKIGANPKIRNITKNGAINKYPHLPFMDGTAPGLIRGFCFLAGFHGEVGLLAFRLTVVSDI